MKSFLNKHFTSIIVGIISSMLFLYFIQPVMEYLGLWVLKLGRYVGAAYVDEVFSQVAHLRFFDFSFFLAAILIGSMGGVSILLAISMLLSKKKLPSSECSDNKPHETLETERVFVSLHKKLLVSILLIIIGVHSFALLSTKVYQLSLISSFERHMYILAPYLTDEEEKMFFGRWSLMNSEKDYNSIYFDLKSVAKKHKIELPSNSVYSFSVI